jgi:hypothetical protein
MIVHLSKIEAAGLPPASSVQKENGPAASTDGTASSVRGVLYSDFGGIFTLKMQPCPPPAWADGDYLPIS